MLPIPRTLWLPILSQMAKRIFVHGTQLDANQRRIRSFVVTQIPKTGKAAAPEHIAENLGLSLAEVTQILDELERGKTFLHRDSAGAVEWAYPVTAAETAHRLIFSTGESISAA